VDETDEAQALIEDERLSFRILSARGLPVLADYGLEHPGAGPEGETIAVPAELLVLQDGSIAWKHVAERITDRATPQEILDEVGKLSAQHGSE